MDESTKLSKLTKETVLDTLVKWFTDASTADRSWKDNAKTWYEYYEGNQWTSEEEETLRDRGQAVSTYNHISPTLDAIIGGERQNRPEIRMIGRTPDDESIAQVKTELYKYISDSTSSDDEIDKQILDVMVSGRGWINVFPNIINKKFDNIEHGHIDYRDMFSDPLSKRDDLSDARFVHQAIYTDSDIIEAQFSEYTGESEDTHVFAFESSSEDELWFEHKNRKRPRLISTWFSDENGEIHNAIWTKSQVLYFDKSPYSVSVYPFAMITYKRDLNNNPYGLVKSMISPQDEVNKRHSKALHYLNARQVMAEEDAFVDWNDAEKTLAKPDGITKLRDGTLSEGRIQIVDNTQLASVHVNLMEHAKSEIMALAGINESYLGQSGQYSSAKGDAGKIAAAQNTLIPFLNKLRLMRHRLAKITMYMVNDFYTEEKLVRVLNPQGDYAFMPVNQVSMLNDGTIKKFNDLSVDDVDIIIEDAPSSLNDRAEQFNQLLGIQGQTGRPIPMEILLRYSNLKDKEQLAGELEAHYGLESKMQQIQEYAQQLEEQVKQLGGVINQKDSQIVQINTARAVDKEVAKAKVDITKEKEKIKSKV